PRRRTLRSPTSRPRRRVRCRPPSSTSATPASRRRPRSPTPNSFFLACLSRLLGRSLRGPPALFSGAFGGAAQPWLRVRNAHAIRRAASDEGVLRDPRDHVLSRALSSL